VDPVVSQVKLIASRGTLARAATSGKLPDIVVGVNGRYRDTVRDYCAASDRTLADFAYR